MIIISNNKIVNIAVGIIRIPFVIITIIALVIAAISTAMTFSIKVGLTGFSAFLEEAVNTYEKEYVQKAKNKFR